MSGLKRCAVARNRLSLEANGGMPCASRLRTSTCCRVILCVSQLVSSNVTPESKGESMAVSEYVTSGTLRGKLKARHDVTVRRRSEFGIRTAAAVTCVLLSAAVVHQTDGKVPDDAFIMFRYAQNLLDGRGWIYNLSHPTTNAVSAPLYTLVLALLGFIIGDVERAATVFFVLTTAASGYLAFTILRKNSMMLGGLAAMCMMIINPWLLATRGLETSAFICLLMFAILLQGSSRHAALGFVLVAATLVRGDGAIFAAVVFFYLWVQARRFPLRLMLGALAGVILWAVAALVIRIPVIPDTLGAKIAQGRSGLWGDMLYIRGGLLAPKVFGFTDWAAVSAFVAGTGLLLAFGLIGFRRYLAPYVLGVLLLVLAYGVVIKPPSYHWYYGPQLVLMVLCGGVTIAVVSRAAAVNVVRINAGADRQKQVGRWFKTRLSNRRRASAAAFVVALLMTSVISAFGWRDIIRGDDRPSYLDAASWLERNTGEGSTVAMTEIGIVGWYSGREMVDFLGLLSEDSVEELSRGDSVSWLSREEPDYWFVHKPQWPGMEDAVSEPWFTLAYRPVWTDETGTLIAWERFRSIADAKSRLSDSIAPQARDLSDQLRIPESDPFRRDAITALIALLSVRNDLRDEYTFGGRVDIARLMDWATSPGLATDRYGSAVERYVPIYRELAPLSERIGPYLGVGMR